MSCVKCSNPVFNESLFCEKHYHIYFAIRLWAIIDRTEGETFKRMKTECMCGCGIIDNQVNTIISILEDPKTDVGIYKKLVARMPTKVFEAVAACVTAECDFAGTLENLEKSVEIGEMNENQYNNNAKQLMYLSQLRDKFPIVYH